MHISDILVEVWSKGHQSQAGIVRVLSSIIGTRGKVTRIDRKTDTNANEAMIEISYYDFIDIFCGMRGGVERILSLLGTKPTTQNSTTQHTPRKRAQALTDKLFNSALQNIRKFMPSGWSIAGTFASPPEVDDLLDTMPILYIKRSIGKIAPRHEKYFHITLKSNASSILRHGLRAGTGRRTDYTSYTNKIFMVTSLEEGLHLRFMVDLLGYNKQEHDVTVFEITLPEDYVTYVDPDYPSYGVFGERAIPPTALKVIYQGKMHDAPWVTDNFY